MMKDVELVHEEPFQTRHGFTIVVSLWSDDKWTAYISRVEPVYGHEIVFMDNDVEWDERPDESHLHDLVDECLEG